LIYIVSWSDDIGESNSNGGGGVGEDNIYKGSKKKPVLALLSDSYLEFEVISVSISRSSSYPISYCLLTTVLIKL